MAVASVLSKVVRRKRTLKDRTREVKGKTKSKKFEEIKKKADEADKKKADKADKKASSPKMAAEKKAARPARGDAKDLKKDDTPRIKRLEALKKNIGQDQKGKINRLFADKAEGNFKGLGTRKKDVYYLEFYYKSLQLFQYPVSFWCQDL